MEIKDLKVGQELVQEYKNEYSLVKIDRLTQKSIFVGRNRFNQRKYNSNWICNDSSYDANRYTLREVDEYFLAKVAKTKADKKAKQERFAAEKLEKETKEAEHQAFLETAEGKKWFATETFWENTEIEVTYSDGIGDRQAEIYIKGNDKKLSNEIKVRQNTKFSWRDDSASYKPCEIRTYNNSFENPKQARRFVDVLLKAAEVAELWTLGRTKGRKKIGEDLPTT